MQTELNNFWKAYIEFDDEDINETREFLKEAGIDIDKAKKEFLELLRLEGEKISKEAATIKKEKGKKNQELFDISNIKEGINRIAEEILGGGKPSVQFREGGELSNEEKQKLEEADRKKLENYRRKKKEGGEK